MCHQSVGLLQGAIEAAGISTIAISVRPEVTANMRVPRAVYVRFPTGNAVGEPHKPHQQRSILRGVLQALETIAEPGTLLEMPYRWKRMPDEDPGWVSAVGGRVSGVEDRDTETQVPAPEAHHPALDAQHLAPSTQHPTPDTRPPVSRPSSPDPDLYTVARQHTAEIQDVYGQLLDAVTRYRYWIQSEVDTERAKPQPDNAKLQALNPQVTYLNELARVLEGPAHDGLVRVSDRVVRIRHWQEGVFI